MSKNKLTKWQLRKQEKERKKQQKREIKEYNQEKRKQKAINQEKQERIIAKAFFYSPLTTNHGDLEMNAIQVWKETKAIKEKREEIVNLNIQKESDIQKLMSLLEKLGLKLQKLNSRKSVETWERYHISQLERMISEIGTEYENIKNSSYSEKIKRMAYERMITRVENIFLRLKKEYNIED